MKYILLLVMLFTIKANSQTLTNPNGTLFLSDKIPFDEEPVYDTVKVIMLVCDTVLNRPMGSSLNFKNNYEGQFFYYRQPPVYWQFGYSVREKHCCVNGNTSNYSIYQPVPYYTHIEYLDDKKKPLSKNIVVWQSKQL